MASFLNQPITDPPAPVMTRRIVQVAVSGGETDVVYALCNDGSLWEMWDDHNWHRLPDVPQD